PANLLPRRVSSASAFHGPLKPKYEGIDRTVVPSIPKYSSSGDRNALSSPATARAWPRRAAAVAGANGQSSANMEKLHESAYRCTRLGRADCRPDTRSGRAHRRAFRDLLRPRLWTELSLLSIKLLGQELLVRSPRDDLFSTMRPASAPAAERSARCATSTHMVNTGRANVPLDFLDSIHPGDGYYLVSGLGESGGLLSSQTGARPGCLL